MSYTSELNQGIAWVASGEKKKNLMLNYFQVIRPIKDLWRCLLMKLAKKECKFKFFKTCFRSRTNFGNHVKCLNVNPGYSG